MTQLWTAADYPPRNGQDSNQMYSGTQLALPSYSHGNGVSFINDNGNNHYSALTSSYSPYPAAYMQNQHATGPVMFLQTSGAVSMSYPMQPPPHSTLPSQPRTLPHHQFYHNVGPNRRISSQIAQQNLLPDIALSETEEQESVNQESMRSEPVLPPLEGFPDVKAFDELVDHYIRNLSPKKQDKALIHAKRAANIRAVLIDKKTTSVESAQFRFWVKKMFTLEPRDRSLPGRKPTICHEGKPVAIREKLFKILTRAHKQCQHGGRDKTSTQVRKVYSWVPKELISRFVKICPACQLRRGGTNRTSPSISDASTGTFMDPQSPELSSNHRSRRQSGATGTLSGIQSPVQLSHFSSTFQKQNRWMTPMPPNEKQLERNDSLEAAASAMINMNMHSPISPNNLPHASSRYADDPGTGYMSPDSMQNSSMMSSHYQHGGYGGLHTMHDIRSNEQQYRPKRGSVLKRERC